MKKQICLYLQFVWLSTQKSQSSYTKILTYVHLKHTFRKHDCKSNTCLCQQQKIKVPTSKANKQAYKRPLWKKLKQLYRKKPRNEDMHNVHESEDSILQR